MGLRGEVAREKGLWISALSGVRRVKLPRPRGEICLNWDGAGSEKPAVFRSEGGDLSWLTELRSGEVGTRGS